MGWDIGERLLECQLIGDDPLPEHILVNFDGLCEPKNPGGVATVAWVIQDAALLPLRRFWGVLADGGPRATNNWAEYTALGKLLRYLVEVAYSGTVIVLGDSALVVNQVNGGWKVNAPHLVPLVSRCQSLIDELKVKGCEVILNWVPREENEAADSLSEHAFLEYVRSRRMPGYEIKFMKNKEDRAKQKTNGRKT
jgi:ribonuclease HI